MEASTPRSSRLAAVANARRRQRKERLSSGSPIATKASGSDSPSFTAARGAGFDKMTSPRTAGNNPLYGIVKKETASPVIRNAGVETETAQTVDIMQSTSSGSANQENINQSNTLNTLTTDDESISTWSQAQSTVSGFTDDSFFAQNQNKVPTNKRKPVNITVVTEEILSPRSILSPTQQDGNVSFRGMVSPQRIFSPRTPSTPKMSGGNAKDNPRNMMKLVGELTQERDRLRSDCNLYKRKLQNAAEDKMAVVQEKDDRITELMKSVGNLTVLIDEMDENCGKELMEVNHKSRGDGKTMKELEQELSSTVCQLNKLRLSYERLKQASAHGRHAMKEKVQSCTIDAVKSKSSVEKLEEELSQVTSEFEECVGELEKALSKEKEYRANIDDQAVIIEGLKKQLGSKKGLESDFDECVEELGRLQREQEDHRPTIERYASAIESLRKEKFEIETAMQERVYEVENKLNTCSNERNQEKLNYERTIKNLTDQLEGIGEMKEEHHESIESYKKKIADLESKLEFAHKETESARKDLSDAKSTFVTRFNDCNKERNEVSTKLEQLMKDFEDAKASRGKDLHLLEIELEKAYASKLETDKQLQDTRRQLHNALHSLDGMAMDGGKMRCELNRIMEHLYKEKDALHKELVELRYQTEEQKNTIYHLNQDNIRCDQSCSELRTKIKELESSSNSTARFSHYSNEKEMMQAEIKYLKNMLVKENEFGIANNGPHGNDARIAELQASDKLKSLELAKAKQTIQKLKTKEKYLELRVESLANQITKTVQEYETRLGEAREMDSEGI